MDAPRVDGPVAVVTDVVDEPAPSAPPDRHYRGYDAWKGWQQLFTVGGEEEEYFRGELRGIPLAGRRVLEIGFGSGSFLAWARAQGAEIAGAEINPTLLAAARQHGVPLVDASIEAIAADHAGRFDVVVAFDVFEHFTRDEVDARLHAVETLLRPGGHAILRFPNGQSPFGLYAQHGDVTHRTPLSRAIVEQLCRDTSLRCVRYAGSYRVRGRFGARRAARCVRALARDAMGWLLNRVYAYDIPWDSVVVLVMQKGGPAR